MTPTTHHSADVSCPDCGNSDAIVRVKGNAISSVCTVCRRADLGPLLDVDDLAAVSPEIEGDLFLLEQVRAGQANPLTLLPARPDDPPFVRLEGDGPWELSPALQVELRMPVPTR